MPAWCQWLSRRARVHLSRESLRDALRFAYPPAVAARAVDRLRRRSAAAPGTGWSPLEPLEPRILMSASPLLDEAVARYDFEDGSGAVVRNLNGTGPDAAVIGTPIWDGLPGVGGDALTLDGATHVELDDAAAALDGPFTASFHFRTGGPAPGQNALLGINTAAGQNKLMLFMGRSGQAGLDGRLSFHDQNGGKWRPSATPDRLDDGAWHHVAVAFDGVALTLHVDGEEVQTLSTGYTPAAGDRWSLGQEFDGGTRTSDHFEGAVDNFRLHDRALDHAEVVALRDAGPIDQVVPKTGPELLDEATARYDFEAGGGSTEPDANGTGPDAKVVGNAAREPGTGAIGNVLRLDGATHLDLGAAAATLYGPFTASFRFRTEGVTPGQNALLGINTAAGQNKLMLFMGRSGQAGLDGRLSFHDQNGGKWRPSATPDRLDDGAWHHVAVAFDGFGLTLHVDGERVQTLSTGYTPASGDRWSLGQEFDGGTRTSDHFTGFVDEVRLHDRALTAAEVRTLRDAVPASAVPLVVTADPAAPASEGPRFQARFGNAAGNGDWEAGLTENTNQPPAAQADFAWPNGEPVDFRWSTTPDGRAELRLGSGEDARTLTADFATAAGSFDAIDLWVASAADRPGSSISVAELRVNGLDAGSLASASGDGLQRVRFAGAGVTDGAVVTGTLTLAWDAAATTPSGSRLQLQLLPVLQAEASGDDVTVTRNPDAPKEELPRLQARWGNNNAGNGDWELGLTGNTNQSPQDQKQFQWPNGEPTAFTYSFSATGEAVFEIETPDGGTQRLLEHNYALPAGGFNALDLWAGAKDRPGATTTLAGLTLNGVVVGEDLAVAASGDTFERIRLEQGGLGDGFVLTGTATLAWDTAQNNPRGSRLQFHLIPVCVEDHTAAPDPVATVTGASAVDEGSAWTATFALADATATGWTVFWGDGTSDDLPAGAASATHTFADGASRKGVVVVARTADGDVTSAPFDLGVANVAPTLTITGPATSRLGDAYELTLAATDPGEDTLTSWTIAWGDGETSTVAGDSPTAAHTYAAVGTYTVTATATDEDGTFASNAVDVAVSSVPVFLSAEPATDEGSPCALQLDDANPRITRWEIDWADGIAPTVIDGEAVTSATHTFADGDVPATDRVVRVTATADNGLVQVVEQPVTVRNVAPALTLSGDPSHRVGAAYTVALAATDPGDDTITTWTIDWGDGETSTVAGTATEATHTYAAEGLRTVSATAADEDGTWASNTIDVAVEAAAPDGLTLVEATRLVTAAATATGSLVVPANADHLRIDYTGLAFDAGANTADRQQNDAFELTVRGADGSAVLPTIGTPAPTGPPTGDRVLPTLEAQFNLSQGQDALTAPGVVHIPGEAGAGSVYLDISSLPQGTALEASARLLNNDADDTTTVTVDFLSGNPAQGVFAAPATASPTLFPVAAEDTTRFAPDLARMGDVTSAFDITYGGTTLDAGGNNQSNRLYVTTDLTLAGSTRLREDLLLAVANVRDQATGGDASAQLASFDGLLSRPVGDLGAGTPYLRLSTLLERDADSFFTSRASVENLLLTFEGVDPDHRFDFDLVVLGQQNAAPAFTSDPYATQQGQAYPVTLTDGVGDQRQVLEIVRNGNDNVFAYDAAAADPDGDDVIFSVITGPAGLTVDDTTGEVTWQPGDGDAGSHQIRLRATDEFGAFDPAEDQLLTLRVVENVANRAPQFTSDPVTSAEAGEPYTYLATAFDPDGDDLTFSVEEGPGGDFAIDLATGEVTWTPTVEQIGETISAVLRVEDGRGGVALQPFDVEVGQNQANRPPVITKLPPRRYVLPGTTSPASGLVFDQDEQLEPVVLNIAPGESFTLSDIGVLIPTSGTTSYEPPEAPDGALTVFNEDDADILLGALLGNGGSGLSINSIDISGPSANFGVDIDARSTGVFVNKSGTYDLNQFGIVLTTGDAEEYGSGPNRSSSFTYGYGSTATSEQQALITPISGFQGFDVTQVDISFDLDENTDSVFFGVVFGSDEFPEFQNSQYIDAFGIFVNGENIARAPSPNDPSIDFPINIDRPAAASFPGTELDGVLVIDESPVIRFEKFIGAGSTNNSLSFLIADTGDSAYDTTAYISSLGGFAPAPRVVEAVASDGDPIFSSRLLTMDPVAPGEQAFFDLELQGDGQAHAFDILFRDVETGELYGSVPVRISADYEGGVQALDPDSDPVQYAFLDGGGEPVAALNGATIDAATGAVTWTPDTVGTFDFRVQANDGRGGVTRESYSVSVTSEGSDNTAPSIRSTAGTDAVIGSTYTYAVDAVDPDGDRLDHYLTGAIPEGASIDRATGILTWTPGPNQETSYTFDVVVSDRAGGVAREAVTVAVAARPFVSNRAPQFTTQPPLAALVGDTYRYDAVARDLDSDAIAYGVSSAPAGLTVDAATGVMVWQPRAEQAGTQEVILRATDSRGLSAFQRFTIETTVPNAAPEITSTAPEAAKFETPYRYQVVASDPNGDTLTYEVDPLSFERGVRIGQEGLLTWTPQAVGTATVGVRVTDGRGGQDTQFFDLYVAEPAANTAPLITSGIDGFVFLNEKFTFTVQAEDLEDGTSPSAGLTFSLDEASLQRGMTINAFTGLLEWTPRVAGTFDALVTVTDSAGASYTQALTLPVNVKPAQNQPASFTSSPTGPAVASRGWSYTVTTTDPDRDDVTIEIVNAPDWLDQSIGDTFTDTVRLSGTPTEGGTFRFEPVRVKVNETWVRRKS